MNLPYTKSPIIPKKEEIWYCGECRTRNLLLEAWDRMEADSDFASLEL